MSKVGLCIEKLHFKTIRHETHICLHWRGHEMSLFVDERKHKCKCGVTWTKDPILAGTNWSQEVDISLPGSQPDKPDDKKQDQN